MTQVKSVPTPELPNASAALLSINNRICLSKAYIPTAALPSSMPCDPGPRPQKKGDCQLLPAETTKRLQINPCREFRRLHCKAKFHCLFLTLCLRDCRLITAIPDWLCSYSEKTGRHATAGCYSTGSQIQPCNRASEVSIKDFGKFLAHARRIIREFRLSRLELEAA